MTNQLMVYINAVRAGVFERDGRLLTFSYSPDYLDLSGALPNPGYYPFVCSRFSLTQMIHLA